ncbi:MAG: choice-of-anchor Q domain-containing protein, partial [Planctomycetota bacterium]
MTWSCVEQGGFAGEGRNFSVDPLFVDAAGGDLRLQQGSPCIDAADGDAAPSLDIDGDPRRDDSGIANRGSGAVTFADVGAFEFQGDSAGSRLSLLAPTQAYAFRVGSELDINWEATSDISEVEVELSRSGGPWVTLVAATANDGEYVWTVDDGGQALPQADCAVRVSDATGGIPSGTSAVFSIFAGVWYVDTDATGGDGLTWSSALSSPRDALARARAGDQIWIAEGTYKPTGDGDRYVSFDLLEGVALYGGFPGTPGTEGDFGSRDADVFVTVLSGDIGVGGDSTDNSYHVVVGASNVVIDGFTISGGRASGYGGGVYNGLYRAESGVVLTDCVFTGNSASSGGGAVYNSNVDDMTITGCVFTGNSADSGGAMYNMPCSSWCLSQAVKLRGVMADRTGGCGGHLMGGRPCP